MFIPDSRVADFDSAAIPPTIISMCLLFMLNSISIDLGMVPVGSETTQMRTPPLREKKSWPACVNCLLFVGDMF